MKKTPEIEKYLKFKKKLQVLNYVKEFGSVREACELFGIRNNQGILKALCLNALNSKA